MKFNRIPRRTDKAIDLNTWTDVVRNSQKTISFDATQFNIHDGPNGQLVSVVPTSTDNFPWDKLLFGYNIGKDGFIVYRGEIHFKKTIYPVAQYDGEGTNPPPLIINLDQTYIYVKMEWGTGITSIEKTTHIADCTANDSYYKKWLYLLNYKAPDSVSIKTIGHMGGAIDLMPIFG